LDILEIENTVGFLKVAEFLQSNPNYGMVCRHRYGLLFDYFVELLNWKMDVEKFMSLWDLSWKNMIFDLKQENSYDFFLSFRESDSNYWNSKILVIDKIVSEFYYSENIFSKFENIFYI